MTIEVATPTPARRWNWSACVTYVVMTGYSCVVSAVATLLILLNVPFAECAGSPVQPERVVLLIQVELAATIAVVWVSWMVAAARWGRWWWRAVFAAALGAAVPTLFLLTHLRPESWTNVHCF